MTWRYTGYSMIVMCTIEVPQMFIIRAQHGCLLSIQTQQESKQSAIADLCALPISSIDGKGVMVDRTVALSTQHWRMYGLLAEIPSIPIELRLTCRRLGVPCEIFIFPASGHQTGLNNSTPRGHCSFSKSSDS